MFNIKFKTIYYLSISTFLFIVDQLSKYLINIDFASIVNQDYILFKIDFVKNYGAAFNILSGNRLILSFISLFISILLVYLIIKKNKYHNLDLYSYSFILGGTLGNGVDRIFKGYVIDFINLNFINFPVFNIADISINIGFFFLLYSFIKNKK